MCCLSAICFGNDGYLLVLYLGDERFVSINFDLTSSPTKRLRYIESSSIYIIDISETSFLSILISYTPKMIIIRTK